MNVSLWMRVKPGGELGESRPLRLREESIGDPAKEWVWFSSLYSVDVTHLLQTGTEGSEEEAEEVDGRVDRAAAVEDLEERFCSEGSVLQGRGLSLSSLWHVKVIPRSVTVLT